MDTVQIDEYAHRLYTAHGDRAEYEAAQKAKECADKGDSVQAENWRRIRATIRQLRGPNAS
jgi:hypothetical protein